MAKRTSRRSIIRIAAAILAAAIVGASGLLTSGAADPALAASPGLVAAYGFDEGSGTTVTDASGTGNNGTIANATWAATGKYGKALQFNGTSARVTVPDAASLHLSSAMTLEAWVRPTTVNGNWRDVIYKGNDNYYLEATSSNASRPDAGLIAGGTYADAVGTAALAANTWSYLAETYDGSAVRLYVNGTQVASTAHTGSIATSTNPLQIGGDSLYGQYFVGMIDEVRVYSTALTAAQIQADQATPVNPSVPDTTPPTQPGTLTATAVSGNEIDLSWGASTDNVGVTGYQVERCAGAGCTNFAQVATTSGTGTTYKDTTVSASTSYSYRVRATDAAGNLSVYSNTASATTPTPDTTPPTQPGTLTATAVSASEVDLSWGASTDNVGVTGYLVERCQGAGCTNFTQIGTTTGAVTTYKDTGRSASTSYTYRVRATDAAANLSPYSNTASATTPAAPDTTPPSQPGTLTATAVSSGEVDLSWVASTDNVGVTGYRVERCAGASCTTFAQIGTPTGTTYNDTTVSPSTTYRYRVRATDAAGNLSTYSNTASATTPAIPDTTPPTQPGTLTASAVSSGEVDLSWGASTDNVGVTGYRVERCQGAGCSNFAQIGTTTGTGTTYKDTTVSASTSYSYRVRATDAAGNLSSYSNTASATTPAASSGLVAAYGFDEGSGTTVTDASGTGNNGTIANATWAATGKYGKALQFNGTSARVTVPDAASLHLSSAMTLEAWVNPSTVNGNWRDVIYKGNDNYYLEATSSNASRPDAGLIAGGTYADAVGTAALAANTWSYLAETYDGSTLRLYVNGTQVASTAHTGSIATSTNPLQIGGDSLYGQYFVGMIDEVRVYNRALSATQIQADQTTSINPTGPPDTIPPSQPGAPTATAVSSGEVDLSWGASTDNVGVSGYQVERCQGSGCSAFTQIASTVATSYQDASVTANTSYSYRVRATDAAGNTGPYSTIASATTPSSLQIQYSGTDANGVASYNYTSSDDGGSHVLRVLAPSSPAAGVPHNFLFVLPVEPEQGTVYGDGLETLRGLNAQNQYNLTIIEPAFGIDPWYADNPNDASLHYETFLTQDLVPWVAQNLVPPAGSQPLSPLPGHEQNWLIGFSKSGIGGQDLLLRHPDVFALAASWDFPADMASYDQFGSSSANQYGTDASFQANYRLSRSFVDARKTPFVSANRIWIGGYQAFQTDMTDYDALLSSEGIAHTTETPTLMSHRWDSGWVPIALSALSQDGGALASTP